MENDIVGILAVTLTFLALLFSGLAPLTSSATRVIDNELEPTKGKVFSVERFKAGKSVLAVIKRLYLAIQLGLALCCALALYIVIDRTLPFIDFKIDVLSLAAVDFPFLVEITGIMMLIWLAWLFYVSAVMTSILSHRKKTIFKHT